MTNPPGVMPPLPDLPKLADLASKYAINFASPHHFVMSVYGLKFLLTELGVDNSDLIARVAELQADAARWKAVRDHWKTAKFTWRRDPANLLKSVTMTIDFDHTGNGASAIEREFDAAIAAKD